MITFDPAIPAQLSLLRETRFSELDRRRKALALLDRATENRNGLAHALTAGLNDANDIVALLAFAKNIRRLRALDCF
jgi:hypothetical protein